MTTRYCPTHARIYQPAYGEARGGYAGRWRPFAPEALVWAQHLAREAGCAGQIVVEVGACDRCAATAAPGSPAEQAAPCLDHTHSGAHK